MLNSTTQKRSYLLLFIFSWLVINFFPGTYDMDSWYQYYEMANKSYDDWHSVWMAYLWKVLFVLTHKFFTLYLFQMAWYFVFFYYLLKRVANQWIVVVGIVLSVFLSFIPQFISKDVHLMLAWSSAMLILLYADEKQPWYARYFALLFMIYGLFLRPNTLPALLPFLYLYLDCYSTKHLTVFRKAAMSLGFGVMLFITYYLLTYFVFEQRRAYPEYKLKLLDVIGITKLSGENYVPKCISTYSTYNHGLVLQLYSPSTIDPMYWPPAKGVKSMLAPPTKERNDSLTKAWKTAILEHPFLYLKNRTEGFLYYLRIWERPYSYYANYVIYSMKIDGLCIDDQPTPFTEKMITLWYYMDVVQFYDPWLWLLLNFVFFIIFTLKYRKHQIYRYKILAGLQLSAILFTLGMLPVFQIHTEFRYSYWNVFAFLIATVYYFGRIKVEPEANT